jgi:hypothetical protein
MERRLLAIYLNDHLAGATGGVELARRVCASNDGTKWAHAADRLCKEIEEDRDTLEQIVERLGIRRDRVKPVGAWAVEKLGRLKLNGRLRGYSPLSRVLELEMLHMGVTGKLEMWSALEHTHGEALAEFGLGGLMERARAQRSEIETMRLEAAAVAFKGEG